MSSRGTQYFAMPDELYAWLGEARDDLHLQFVLEKNNCIFEAVSLADLEAGEYGHHLTPWRFYIGDDATTPPIVDPDLNPNRWGLVTCDHPEIVDGDTLLMAEISSKSDYPDENRMTRENPAGHPSPTGQTKRVFTAKTPPATNYWRSFADDLASTCGGRAPERLLGLSGDERSDQFSFCVCLEPNCFGALADRLESMHQAPNPGFAAMDLRRRGLAA
jgi:hypothetical protein